MQFKAAKPQTIVAIDFQPGDYSSTPPYILPAFTDFTTAVQACEAGNEHEAGGSARGCPPPAPGGSGNV